MAQAAVRMNAVVLLLLTFFIVTPIVGVCNCSMFCCTMLFVHSSIAIILMGKRELVALLNLSSRYLVMAEWLFLAVSWGCLLFGLLYFLIILTILATIALKFDNFSYVLCIFTRHGH